MVGSRRESRQYLGSEIKDRIEESYSIFNDGINKESLHVFSEIAIKRLQVKQIDRPTMKEVVKELRRALRLQVKGFDDLRISYKHIKYATNHFDSGNIIDTHYHGTSFKGEISTYKGHTTAAILRLHSFHTFYKDFLKEVEALFDLEHESITSVQGFCEEMGERFIVYEYASRGTLELYLGRADVLTWMRRLKICISLAHALEHLHSLPNADHSVGRCGMTSSNILLNENWDAKFYIDGQGTGDYGRDLTFNHDPEYTETGYYSMRFLGKILLEMVCGSLQIGTNFGFQFIAELYERDGLRSIMIPEITKQIAPGILDTYARTGYSCLTQHGAYHSPVRELEEILSPRGARMGAESSTAL